MIKVGQIYTDGENKYVVTHIWSSVWNSKDYFESINTDGEVRCDNSATYAEQNDKLIAEYPTWQEAVNSKEFNNAD